MVTDAQRSDVLQQALARTALGERAAFASFYEATKSAMFGIILRIQPDRALAEDVLQEVYVNVWRAAASYDAAVSQPWAWLIGIARHRAIDSLRRRKAQLDAAESSLRSRDDDDEASPPSLADRVPTEAPGPLELLEQAADRRDLRRCLTQLSAQQQQSLALVYYQGCSHAEVAQQLGQPLGTIKSWVRRGLAAVKGCLLRAASAGLRV